MNPGGEFKLIKFPRKKRTSGHQKGGGNAQKNYCSDNVCVIPCITLLVYMQFVIHVYD